MRDHPLHGAEILAGMFGIRKPNGDGELNSGMEDVFKRILSMSRIKRSLQIVVRPIPAKVYSFRHFKQLDQSLLREHLWESHGHDSLAHDSYFCRSFPKAGSEKRAFPTQRVTGPNFARPNEMNFVGSNGGILGRNGRPAAICPEECRPADHKDWILC